MNNKEAKNRKKIISYDEDGGLLFMKNWSPRLRWLSLLPAMIITYIAVRVLFLDTIISIIEKLSYLLSLYISAILSGLVYMTMTDAIGSVAPKKRVLTGAIFAIIFGVLTVIITLFAMRGIFSMDIESSLKNHYLIVLAIASISNISGLFLGVSIIKSRQKKIPQV
ncbi:hypothetical protein RHO12_02805 [Orbus sturtevantii]|uniref:hypothetical protein n=1 Tax=Orbus sturtevantii TaxID=3074109 RepID=UPI00370D1BCF